MRSLALLVGALAALAALAVMSAAAYASPEKRVALVIGNADYEHAAPLRNPANDAERMARKLEDLSFKVIKGINLNQNQMRKVINTFAQQLANANAGLIFYAGHGLQVDGNNYLLPVDAELRNEIDLQFQGVNVNFLLSIMENRKRTSILLLDACRNNPLAERLARSLGSTRGRSISSGLARIESGVGTYIGFSTSPNSVALDGDGDNSPFTEALLEHIDTSEQDIESIMRNVRSAVIDKTNGSQVPWGNSSLVGRGFVFRKAEETKEVASLETPPVAPVARPAQIDAGQVISSAEKQLELAFWNTIKDQNDVRMLISYLSKYPNGEFADLARIKIDAAIAGKQVSSVVGPSAQPAPPPVAAAPPAAPEPVAPEPVRQAEQPAAATRSAEETRSAEQAEDNQSRSHAEAIYWQSIADSTDPRFFEAYLEEFPDGMFSSLARLKIALLTQAAARKAEAESATPEPAEPPEEVASVGERGLDVRPVVRPDVRIELKANAKTADRPQDGTGDTAAATPADGTAKGETVEDEKPEPTRADIRELQQQLNRLGCSVGRADGIWGRKSRNALRDYADHSGVQLAALEPSFELLDGLKSQSGRICPLECRRGFAEKGGQCVRIAPPPSVKKKRTPRRRVVQQAPPPRVVIQKRRPVQGAVTATNPAFRDNGTEDP